MPYIRLPQYLSCVAFENLLKSKYVTSLNSSDEDIHFDFQAVQWLDPLPLALVVLWICELLGEGKRVRCTLLPTEGREPTTVEAAPDRHQDILMRLHEWRFTTFLQERGILDRPWPPFLPVQRPKRIDHPISPLTFFSEFLHFNDYLTKMERQPELYFGATTDIDVVRSGAIRNVVLRELGDNIFQHAAGRYATLLMTRSDPLLPSTPNAENILTARILNAPNAERPFFQALRSHGFITVIICDKGPGIMPTLAEAYSKDTLVPKRPRTPREDALTMYAFLQHSTSKSPEERLNSLRAWMAESDLLDVVPATGLYYVARLAQDYNALLTVRTGATYTTLDFLTYKHVGHRPDRILSSSHDRHLSGLCDFGGVQIKLVFPLIPTSHRLSPPFKTVMADSKTPHKYMAITGPQVASDGLFALTYIPWYDATIRQIQKLKLASTTFSVIVLDCYDWVAFDANASKALFLVLVEIMRIQSPSFTVVLWQRQDQFRMVVSALNEVQLQLGYTHRERALLGVTDFADLVLYGASATAEKTVRQLWEGSTLGDEAFSETARVTFESQINHLLSRQEPEGVYRLRFSAATVVACVKAALERSICETILSEANRIYHSDKCFLLPWGAYSEGYFELTTLFTTKAYRDVLVKWLRCTLVLLDISVAVGIGKAICDALIEAAPRSLEVVRIENLDNTAEAAKLSLLPANERVVLVTDVIGTEMTVSRVLGCFGHVNIVGLITVVDARPSDRSRLVFGGSEYSITAALRHSLKYWFQEKPAHRSYEEIVRVDPISKAPVWEPFFLGQAVWKQLNEMTGRNEYMDVLRATGGPLVGHFENAGRHILYLFLTGRIVEAFLEELGKVVADDVRRYAARDTSVHPGEAVITYPQFTPGVAQLAVAVGKELETTSVLAVTEEELLHPLSYTQASFRNHPVLFVDDAAASGYTARRILELAERNGASSIFVYVICNRADRVNSRLLQKVLQYGKAKVHVRFLAHLPIPTFRAADCPACRRRLQLLQVRHHAQLVTPLTQVIDEEVQMLQKQSLQSLSMDDIDVLCLATPLQTRVERTKLRCDLEMAKHILPIRRQLVRLVKDHQSRPEAVLRLFECIAFEAEYLKNDEVTFGDVFYHNFREDVLKACRSFLGRIKSMAPPDVQTVARILALLSPDILIEELEAISDAETLAPATRWRLILEVLVVWEETTAQNVLHIVGRLASPEVVARKQVLDIWQQLSSTRRLPSTTLQLFKAAEFLVGDSGHLASRLSDLNDNYLRDLDLDRARDVAFEHWPEVERFLGAEVVPAVRLLADALGPCGPREVLEQRLSVAYIVFGQTRQAFEMFIQAPPLLASSARDEFCSLLDRLSHVMLGGESGTLPAALGALRTELTSVVNRVLDQFSGSFHRQNIQLTAKLPKKGQTVFGDYDRIYTIVRNAVENVANRAFEGHSGPRICHVGLEIGEDALVRMSIDDSGRGLPDPLIFGAGLTAVKENAGELCGGWGVAAKGQGEPGAKFWALFFPLPTMRLLRPTETQ